MSNEQSNHAKRHVNNRRRRVSSRFLLVALCVGFVACTGNDAVGCGAEPALFDTPSATIESLFTAYGVQDLTEAQVRARLIARERFDLVDEALYRACFTKWRGDHDDGLGGYVFGRLVAGKDHLLVKQEGDTAEVTTEGEPPGTGAVILRKVGKRWKIDLMASIPEDVKKRLFDVYRRAERQERGVR